METSEQHSDTGTTSNQREFARELNIADVEIMPVEQLIEAIEAQLRQDTMLEQARWFLMSVLRKQAKEKWQRLEESSLEKEEQYRLANLFLENDDYIQSLRTVLKDGRCRFTLLGFAKTRKPERHILSTTTKAYKRARQILIDATLIKAGARSIEQTIEPSAEAVLRSASDDGSVVSRRAARRGYSPEAVEVARSNEPVAKQELDTAADEMSEEEYEELEKVLTDSAAEGAGKHWQYKTNEDRLSLLMGLAAGCGFFAVVFWLLL